MRCCAANPPEESRLSRTRVIETLEDGVLLLTLNRPERKNAFDEIMWRETRDALAEAQENDAVRCVVVTGAGDAFSAGQDLGQMAQASSSSAQRAEGERSSSGSPQDGPPGFPTFMDRLVAFAKQHAGAESKVGIVHCALVLIQK